MTAEEIASQLQRIAATDDFASSAKLAESWSFAGAGIEAVEPILRFHRTAAHQRVSNQASRS